MAGSTDMGLGELLFTGSMVVFIIVSMPQIIIPVVIFLALDRIKI